MTHIAVCLAGAAGLAFLLWRVYGSARHVWRVAGKHHEDARPVPLPGGFPGREFFDAPGLKRN